MTISRSMDFPRATASAICSSSSRLAEMPVRLMGGFLLVGSLVFGVGEAGGAGVRAPLQELIGKHELGLDDPRERDQRGLGLVLEVDGDLAVVDAGQHALEALAALGQAVEF